MKPPEKIAREIIGKWGYEEPSWWEPIAAALHTREIESLEEAAKIVGGMYRNATNQLQACAMADAVAAIQDRITGLKEQAK